MSSKSKETSPIALAWAKGMSEMQRRGEEHMHFVESLKIDLENIPAAMAEQKRQAREADFAVVTIACCDSRQALPENLVTTNISIRQGEEPTAKKVLFVTITTIGGGAPSRSRLREVVKQLQNEWGVDPHKIKILVTQHGDDEETQHALEVGESDPKHITCGLRKFFHQHETELSHIGAALHMLANQIKINTEVTTWAPDRVELDELRKLCNLNTNPIIKYLFYFIEEYFATQEAGTRLPLRLMIRAAYRNGNPGIQHNLHFAEDAVSKTVIEQLPELMGQGASVVDTMFFDHKKKALVPVNGTIFTETCNTGLPERHDSHQDPQYVSISFGVKAIPYSVRALFPHLFGSAEGTPIDNAFRTVASIPTVPTLLCALSEAMYAVIHKVHPHDGDKNFRSLQRVVLICQDTGHVNVVKEMMKHTEFRTEYEPLLRQLNPDGLDVVNLDIQQNGVAGTPSHEVVAFAQD